MPRPSPSGHIRNAQVEKCKQVPIRSQEFPPGVRGAHPSNPYLLLSSLLPLVLSHLERSRCVYRCDRDSGLGRKITELDHAYARVAKEGTATLTHERTRTHYLHDARVLVGGPCSRSRWCLFSAVLDLNKPARRPASAHQGSLGGPRRRTRGRSRGGWWWRRHAVARMTCTNREGIRFGDQGPCPLMKTCSSRRACTNSHLSSCSRC